MKLPTSLLLLVLALPAFGQSYYISPAGNDANPGTMERPFASLRRAQQAARQKPGTVFLRGGTYYLPETLVFTAQDSGTKDAPAVFQAYKNERPVISGGVKLNRLDWQPGPGGVFHAKVPEDLRTEEIFLNGERQILARYPNFDPKAARNPLFNYSQVNKLEDLDRTAGPRKQNYPADCLVEDCLIYLTGRVEKQTAGVNIDLAQNITVRHCSIYDMPRAGINIGDGCWGGHIVEFCDVFDTVKETGDHGSFNSWGRDRYWRPNIAEVNAWVQQVPELPRLDAVKPVILRNNRWRCDHGWDIDLDDGSSFYVISNNLCLRGGIKNREGYGRVVENNIMVGAGFDPHVWFAASGDIFRRNIVWRDYRPALMYAPPWGQEMDRNLMHKDGAEPAPAGRLQQQSGRDEHSLVADAQFVDPAKGDYRVKDGSPALALGFVNFPMDRFGMQKPELKALTRTPVLPSPKPAPDATSVK